jgi:hypothetical protein
LPNVTALFDAQGEGVNGGNQPFPGLDWYEGAGNPTGGPGGIPTADYAPPFRRYVWLMHQASPVLFQQVGSSGPGAAIRQPVNFVRAFMAADRIFTSTDGRANTPKLDRFNTLPQFFTFNGQSGHYSHNNASITPMHRVGEPTMISVMNAGLMTHSQHLHANHFYLLAVGNVDNPVNALDFYRDGTDPQNADNPIWIDVYQIHAMSRVDWLVPFMRIPDHPNIRGIGLPDDSLFATSNPSFPGFPGVKLNQRTWPPIEEFTMHHPKLGTIRRNFDNTGNVDISVSQSPLCYPSHDHSEPSQTSQGANYNTGLISGMYLIGDRNGMMNFPIDEADGDDFQMMLDMALGTIGVTGPAAGPNPP